MLFLKQKTFFDLFPTPEFLLLSTAGLAVTDADVRFVELKRELFGRGLRLTHSSRMANPEGAVESGLISSPDKLVPVLKKLSSRHGIRYVRASLPEEKAYLFTTTISRVSPEGLKDAVAFVVEENVPVSLAESVFDFEIVSEDKSMGELKVAVSVVSKNIVDAYVNLFESAGITPIAFDLESQAIARAVIHRGDKRSHLIINLSSKKTGLYVVEEEVGQFSTTLSYGTGGDDSYPNLDGLKEELRKVLTFWNTRTDKRGLPEKKIERALLCGIGASRRDFVEKLMSDSGIPYALADVWLSISSSRSHIPEMSLYESLDHASAMGLALPRRRQVYV